MTYYAPAQQFKLQPMHPGQPEFRMQNVEVPDNRPMTWPVSQPTKQQNRIHISINRENRNLVQPSVAAQTTFCDYPYRPGSPVLDFSHLQMRKFAHQTVVQQSAFDDDTFYSCKFLAQLQGNYEIETPEGRVEVSVILPKVDEHEEQYAKVNLVSSDGKALSEKFIYHELSWFKLCSANRKLEGVLMEGSNMKHTVEWWNADDESWIVWRRKGNVTFNLVQVDPNSRRNSISSVCTVSTSAPVAYSIDTSTVCSDENPMRIRTELLQPRKPVFINRTSNGSYSPPSCLQSNSNNIFAAASSVTSDRHHEEMFELIKAQCSKNPVLFKKVVDWVVANNPTRTISQDETKYISEGRFWITAHSDDSNEGEVTANTLDDIKGAYQETSAGVYSQPDPKECGSSVQHRLFKDEHGFWMLERRDVGCERWHIRARQQEDERWVDFRNNKVLIRVQVVPMNKILENMGEDYLASKNEINKSIDFLFTSCNQEKLTKLKGRNLKHHIANLKVKLEKRYALSFGVRVANTAETIAQEL